MKYAYDTWEEKLDEVLALFPIPIKDEDAWEMYPDKRWMFNKLNIFEAQNLDAAPHGIDWGDKKEVFSKPIYNLFGLSAGTKEFHGPWNEEYYVPGHMWCELLKGSQFSTDIVIDSGIDVWAHTVQCFFNKDGSAFYWQSCRLPYDHQVSVDQFIFEHFKDFTGCVTLETKGGHIFEAVPRCSAQFIDLYGADWIDNTLNLYQGKPYSYNESTPGISYVSRVPKSYGNKRPYVHNREMLKALEAYDISIYFPWYNHTPLNVISDDPYSYRLAVINGHTTNLQFYSKMENEVKKYIRYE